MCLRAPNTPCALNPSSPINLFKAASIASRSFFWLIQDRRIGWRPVAVGGRVRLAFIAKTQADLARNEKGRFVPNSLQLSAETSSCPVRPARPPTPSRFCHRIGISVVRFGGLHRLWIAGRQGGRIFTGRPGLPDLESGHLTHLWAPPKKLALGLDEFYCSYK
jgi:hypothetical protein